MSGDWIKMRSSLCTNPRTLMIAEIIGASTEAALRLTNTAGVTLDACVTRDVTRDVTLGALLRVWSAANDHTEAGVMRNATRRTVDQAAGVPGFAAAMERVGWLQVDDAALTVTFPNFIENNAPSKGNSRMSPAERQAKYRQRQKEKAALDGPKQREIVTLSDVTRHGQSDVTSDAREDKIREDIYTPSRAGEACKAMKGAGMQGVNPSSPKLVALLDAGITLDELVAAATDAVQKGKPFAYALASAEGRRRDAATPALPPAQAPQANGGRFDLARTTVPDNPDVAATAARLAADAALPRNGPTAEQRARLEELRRPAMPMVAHG